ncbi:MAG: TetR/AcrR family transcriptional regulator [Actinobacteria bacterium]|nr:MAG: TetR/AcrR family transcriptional regulator [Actinomycetota bacterium]
MSTEVTYETRRYRKRLRAEQEHRTRQAITEAAMRLHGTVGPARTTVSAVADEAGVQRATVYRHFPDEATLFEACSSHYASLHPPPDLSVWAEIRDPGARLRRALSDLYGWWEETEDMMSRVFRDAPLVESMAGPVAAGRAYLDEVRRILMRGRPERGKARKRVSAAIGHAIAFSSWQSLVRDQGLAVAAAVELMAEMVDGRANGRKSTA